MNAAIKAKKLDPGFFNEVVSKACTAKNKIDLYNCLACGMCSAGCPYNGVHDHADPRKFIRQLVLGMREEGAPCRAQQELSDHRTNVLGNTLRTTPNRKLPTWPECTGLLFLERSPNCAGKAYWIATGDTWW